MYGLVDCNTEVFLIYNKSLLKIIDQILEEEYSVYFVATLIWPSQIT